MCALTVSQGGDAVGKKPTLTTGEVEKQVAKMPRMEQVRFANLVEDLMRKGPIRKEWNSFSKLSPDE